ncbi:hypothetical protein [Streptomyces longhuiensis]|uniref:hypothetical protein n=1 Tax=Streptomyces longhuiensis TaxID=2880933 RepID=UPI001D0ABB66|nr:hypothetical protein [Streptomyces longhuiensis]UDM00045.1 hypothetical protein LGI35_18050 [Streptomyces longhuiensis]
MTTPHERLTAEEIPTGTFGHALPPRPAERPTCPGTTWTAIQQAQHCADLLEAITDWVWDEETRADERRHLQLVETESHKDAA